MESMEMNAPAAAKSSKLPLILGVLVVVAALAVAYFGWQLWQMQQDPNAANQKKIEEVVVKVEKIIDLPQGEVPTLATVSDTANLKNQPFFANAEVGDQVLLYTNAKKAYLYSPTKNIIVEVASLTIGE